ncbi:MAG: hypothetical protein ACR2HN_09900 [Tepidiformaceae bacterium]
MRLLCLYLPRLATELALRGWPQLGGTPAVLLTGAGESAVVSAVSSEAAAAAVVPGMTAGDARRLCPRAAFLPDNAGACLDELDRLAAILAVKATPLVEAGGRDHLFLQLDGVAEQYGGESAAAARIAEQARAWGQTDVRAGVGSSREAALRASRLAHRAPGIDGAPARAAEPSVTPLGPLQVAAGVAFQRPVSPEGLAAALAPMLGRATVLLAGRSFRQVTIALQTGGAWLTASDHPSAPAHDADIALNVIEAAFGRGIGTVTAARLTFGRLGPGIQAPPAARTASGRRAAAPLTRRPRQLLLRAAS